MTEPQGAGRWLVPDWRWVLRYAWSVRLLFVAALLTGGEAAIGVLTAFSLAPSWLPPGALAVLAFAVSMAALVARFMAQTK